MRSAALWSLMPDEALPLVIAGVGLLIIVGLLTPKRGLAIVGALLLSILALPFLDVLLDMLPWWALLILTVAALLAMVRGMVSLLLGERATDHMVGILAADVARGCFRLLFLPFRLLLPRRPW